MVTIKFANTTCQISGLEESVKYEIAEKLSYESGGYCEKKTTKYLFNILTCQTYTGLIPHIIKILKKHKINFELLDMRIKPEQNANFKISNSITLYDYQQKVVDNSQSRMIIQMATGAGKTLVLASLIAKINVKPVVVMAPKTTLAYQLKEELQKFLGIKIGIYTGAEKDIQDITIATPLTALNSDLIKDCKVLLFDEMQFVAGHTLFTVARNARNAYYKIGVSATPWRDGNDDILLEAALNVRNPKTNISASMLIRKGKLTPCTITFIEQKSVCDWLGNYAKTYNKAIMNNVERNNKIINKVKESIRNDDGSILILINKIKHGQMILERIQNEVGYTEEIVSLNGKDIKINSVEFLSGRDDMEKRNAVLQGVRECKCKILIGSTIADEGLDAPILKVLILAGSGKSSTRAFQRIGRVLRLFKNRNQANVYDFMDMNSTFYNQYLYRLALYETESEWKIKYEKIAS